MRRLLSIYGRYLLVFLGLLAIVLLVRELGPREVWEALWGAGVWLPLILTLDLGWMATESSALLLLYGDDAKKVRGVDWLRALFVHFATFTVVPMGRVSAEVARASVLAERVGRTKAAAGAALMQALTLSANALITGVCLTSVVFVSAHAPTSALLTLNILMTGTLGVGLYLVLLHVEVGGFLGRRFKKLSSFGPEIDEHVRASTSRHFGAFCLCVLSRLVQTIQYGVILLAIVGDATVVTTFVAQGIQLSARSVGDAIPNQVGFTEGAFALSAAALDLGDAPGKAVAVALLARVSSLTVAGLSAISLQLLPRTVKARA